MTEVEPVDESAEKTRYPTTMNVNRYATKKTIAQGMLDIALLTANASQLKYVLQVGKEKHPFYTLMVTLISVSIVLQVISGCLALSANMLRECRLHLPNNVTSAMLLNYFQVTVGVCFLFIGSLNINKPKSQRTAEILNNLITIQIFIITVINVIVSSFGIEHVLIEENRYEENSRRIGQGLVRRDTPQLFETGQLFANGTISSGKIYFDEKAI